MATTTGIHHITAIGGPAQETLDFYTAGLGLRLVKTTVNFDDPSTYHLYFGDATGQPGTILTFFPWVRAVLGRLGAGMVHASAFAVPMSSIAYWMDRLWTSGAQEVEGPTRRFGESVIRFRDPHGLPLEIVGTTDARARDRWTGSPVPAAHAIRGFHGATLALDAISPTAGVLTDLLGLEANGEEGGRQRYQSGASGQVIDLVTSNQAPRMGQGTVHHIAFRAVDEDEQAVWREELQKRGFRVTDVRDRQYFKSIYFREPGGVLFEIATDVPGFLRDESEAELGTTLTLPPWLEDQRETIERKLPPMRRDGAHAPK
jgi:glyoxalase family protein